MEIDYWKLLINTHGSTFGGCAPSLAAISKLCRQSDDFFCSTAWLKKCLDHGQQRPVILLPSSRLSECLCFCSCAVIQKWRKPGSLFGQPMGKASLCSDLWEQKHWFYRQDYKLQKKKRKKKERAWIPHTEDSHEEYHDEEDTNHNSMPKKQRACSKTSKIKRRIKQNWKTLR